MRGKLRDITAQKFGYLTALSISSKKPTKWKCKCDCGNIKDVRLQSLVNGESQSCGECYLIKRKDMVGQQFNRLTVLSYSHIDKHGRVCWLCKCDCNSNQTKIVSRNDLISGHVQSCGCLRGELNWKGHEEISGTYLHELRSGAKNRNIEFLVTPEYMWILYIKQNRKCALTHLDIKFRRSYRKYDEQTASLDRIDSHGDYTQDNIQWVHKDVQKMKFDFTQDRYKEICRLVAEHDNRTKQNI